MGAIMSCSWPVGAGQTLEFEIFDRNEAWKDVAGLYIFAYQQAGSWHALYVGQAESLAACLPKHDRLPEAVQKGATHIHAKPVRLKRDRDDWEHRLIEQLQPPLNLQQR